MKILFIETLGDGGIAHYTHNLVNALKKRECDVTLITTSMYELIEQKESIRLHCIFFKFAFALIRKFSVLSKETSIPTLLRRLIKIIEYPINVMQCLLIARSAKADIIHFQTIHLIDMIMVIMFKVFGLKIVYTIHNVMPGHKKLNPLQRLLYGFFYYNCNFLIIHSDVSKKTAVKLYWINPEKVFVVPHGDYKFFVPDIPLSKDEAKDKLGFANESKIILFFGAIRQNKGLQDILAALPRIKETIPNVLLAIVGEALRDYKKYTKQVALLGIRDCVYEMLEYVPNEEVHVYFCASDLVVLPYTEISQSGVLQVAYAFGKPVVATCIGGFQEAVKDGENGFLVPPGDPDILAAKIIEVLNDSTKMESMGKNSLFLSDTKYSWDSIAEKTNGIYEELLNIKRSPSF